MMSGVELDQNGVDTKEKEREKEREKKKDQPAGPSSAARQVAKGLKRDSALFSVGMAFVFVGWLMAFFWVGSDLDQGNVYRIIYVHVPVAWSSFLWVIVSAVFAVRGLIFRKQLPAMDLSSHAALELGCLFAALSLLTGMIWGRPTWGVWWDWDPRLVSTLVMFLVCCGYLLLRSFTPDLGARRLVSAGVAVLAAINVPIVYYSVNIWRSIHQPQTFTRGETSASPDIRITLFFNVLALTVLGYAIYRMRRGGLSLEHALEKARQERD